MKSAMRLVGFLVAVAGLAVGVTALLGLLCGALLSITFLRLIAPWLDA